MPITDCETIFRSILDPNEPFRIFFCVREIGRKYFNIGHVNEDHYHLIYVPEVGDLLVETENEERVVEVGELLWIQPNVKFNVKGLGKPGKINISVCRFDMDLMNPYRVQEDFLVGTVKPRDLVLNGLLPGHRLEAPYENLRSRAIITQVLSDALFEPEKTAEQSNSEGLSPPVRKRCIEYIQANIHHKIVIAEIAQHVKLNADYFARQFKKSFGISPQSWIKNIRVQEAADHLLSGSSSITEIADQFGYNNVYFFSRQFREVMGISPKKWLKQQIEEQG